MIIRFEGKEPVIHETVFAAPNSAIIGDVAIRKDSSVWFGAVLRGDEAPITVGERSNIQDNATVHCDSGMPAVIGDDVTIGHNAVIHSCVIGDRTVIGMGAVVLSGAVVGEDCIVAAGAVVKSGCVILPRTLVAGIPAEVKKTLTDGSIASNLSNAAEYIHLSKEYKKNC
ncbi:MAG: gamma carbonic anhydrase family protein [Saccharofermentanales bacterium]